MIPNGPGITSCVTSGPGQHVYDAPGKIEFKLSVTAPGIVHYV
jgi:hypothetical protein